MQTDVHVCFTLEAYVHINLRQGGTFLFEHEFVVFKITKHLKVEVEDDNYHFPELSRVDFFSLLVRSRYSTYFIIKQGKTAKPHI